MYILPSARIRKRFGIYAHSNGCTYYYYNYNTKHDAGDNICANYFSFIAVCTRCGADGDNIVHADHIADRAAHILERDDHDIGKPHHAGRCKLKRSEQSVGNRVGSRHVSSQHADKRCDEQVSAAGDIRHSLSHGEQHRIGDAFPDTGDGWVIYGPDGRVKGTIGNIESEIIVDTQE